MGFIRDAGDLYAYAAIGGNLEVGQSYAPEMFVVIHDGARPDKKSLGAVFKPTDPQPNTNQFLPDTTGSTESQAAAKALVAEYKGMNTYQFLVSNVKAGVIPAGTAAAVAAAPFVPESVVAPAAPASEPSAAVAAGKNPTWLSKLFKPKGKRKQPAVDMPTEPGVRAKAIAFRVFSQVTAGSGMQLGGESGPVSTFAGQIQNAIKNVKSKKAIAWFSKTAKEVLPDSLLQDLSMSKINTFLNQNDVLDEEVVSIYEMILTAYNETKKIKARNAAFDQRMKGVRASFN